MQGQQFVQPPRSQASRHLYKGSSKRMLYTEANYLLPVLLLERTGSLCQSPSLCGTDYPIFVCYRGHPDIQIDKPNICCSPTNQIPYDPCSNATATNRIELMDTHIMCIILIKASK